MSDPAIVLSIGGFDRRYLVHNPGHDHSPRPVVLVLHGAGGSGSWARDETLWDRKADKEGFVVAYPEALAVDPSKNASFLGNPRVWNAGAGPGLVSNRTHDDVEFLEAVIDDLSVRFSIDATRVFVAGFSNGAAMTFRLAERSTKIAAIAPVAGLCPEVKSVARPMPTLFMVGDADPLLPLDGGEVLSPWTGQIKHRAPLRESLARWAMALAADPEPRFISDSDGVRIDYFAGSVPIRWMTIAGLGHHWPGGRGRLKRSLAGQPSNRVIANDVIWDFFNQPASSPSVATGG